MFEFSSQLVTCYKLEYLLGKSSNQLLKYISAQRYPMTSQLKTQFGVRQTGVQISSELSNDHVTWGKLLNITKASVSSSVKQRNNFKSRLGSHFSGFVLALFSEALVGYYTLVCLFICEMQIMCPLLSFFGMFA